MTNLRRATAADVVQLSLLAAEAYAHYVPRIGREPAPITADYACLVKAGQVWVLTEDEQLVGLIVLVPDVDPTLGENVLLVENVAVRPAAQGRGLGTRLMALAETEAHRLGLRRVSLYTNQAMTENLGYYSRLGYTETHRSRSDGFDRVFFSKSLTFE